MTDKKNDPPSDQTTLSSETHEDDEKVGYGMPPKAHRFRKGVSGNKNGRPKKRPTLVEAAIAILEKPMTVSINGSSKKMRTWDALMHTAVNMAAKGRPKPLLDLLKATGAMDAIVKQNAAERTPRVRVIFPGSTVSAAGEMIRTDAEGNVWTNPEGSNYATVLLKKADKAED